MNCGPNEIYFALTKSTVNGHNQKDHVGIAVRSSPVYLQKIRHHPLMYLKVAVPEIFDAEKIQNRINDTILDNFFNVSEEVVPQGNVQLAAQLGWNNDELELENCLYSNTDAKYNSLYGIISQYFSSYKTPSATYLQQIMMASSDAVSKTFKTLETKKANSNYVSKLTVLVLFLATKHGLGLDTFHEPSMVL